MLYKVTGAGHSVCVGEWWWRGGQSSVVRGVREGRGARTGVSRHVSHGDPFARLY